MTKIDELMALSDEYALNALTLDCASKKKALRTALEAALKPGSEPVAWLIRIGAAPHWSYCETEADADFYGKQSGMRYEKKPLFAAPPRREPLTDEQIELIWNNNCKTLSGWDHGGSEVMDEYRFEAATRAIEAAHDIGVKP